MKYNLFQAASNVSVIFDSENVKADQLKQTMENAMEQFTSRSVEDPMLVLQLKNFLYEEGFDATISTIERGGQNSSPAREETAMLLDVTTVAKKSGSKKSS